YITDLTVVQVCRLGWRRVHCAARRFGAYITRERVTSCADLGRLACDQTLPPIRIRWPDHVHLPTGATLVAFGNPAWLLAPPVIPVGRCYRRADGLRP